MLIYLSTDYREQVDVCVYAIARLREYAVRAVACAAVSANVQILMARGLNFISAQCGTK